MRNFRFYFVMGLTALLAELIFMIWSYGVVTDLDSSQEQQHSIISDNKNHNNLFRDRSPDGTFNGYPVYYHDLTLDKTYHSRPYSSVRCVGENYQGDDFSWMHRSCHFRFLCFNVSSREFEVFARPDDETLDSMVSNLPFFDLSASLVPPPRVQTIGWDTIISKPNIGVSLGSGTVRHSKYYFDKSDNDRNRLRQLKEDHKWFPTVIRSSPPEQYYALEEDVVFVPFHSMLSENLKNQGKEYSAVWNDLFPIYTLLNIFQMTVPDKEALLMRYVSNSGHDKDETKDYQHGSYSYLLRMMEHFRPLMVNRHAGDDTDSLAGRHDRGKAKWTTQIDATLLSSGKQTLRISEEKKSLESGLVCAKDGVAGLGPHGIRYMEGRNQNTHVFHNQGKGGILWMFRNYCIGNLGLLTSPSPPSTIRVLFSETQISMVSTNGDSTHEESLASIGTELQEFLSSKTNHGPIEVESHAFSNDENIDMISRVRLMMDTTVFIATCSDATATAALFLPKGASLIIFCDVETSNHEESARKSKSVCPGYEELLNNLSHVFVHWLPMNTFSTKDDREVFFEIVERATRVK